MRAPPGTEFARHSQRNRQAPQGVSIRQGALSMKRMLLAAGIVAALGLGSALAADIKQGGTLTVTYKDDFSTLDPAIGYDWQNWSPLKSLFSRLMDYKPGTTELAPDLAESYEVSPD